MQRFLHAAVLALAVWVVPHAAGAQSTSGTISGIVTDESKGVLPGVAIEVVNADTGVARSLITGPDGRYKALSLPPGTYRVTAELSGFGKVQRDALIVTIGGELVEDIRLKVGGVNETVTVSAERMTVGLGSAVVGGVVTTTQIAELPLNGRSFMQLATLQPGVSVSRTTERDFTGGFGATQVSIGGARPE
jgi:hypothetical protein